MTSSNNTSALPTFPSSLLRHEYAVYLLYVINQPVPYEVLGVYSTLPAANNKVREALAHHNYREWHETENGDGLIGVDAFTTAGEMVRIRIDKVLHNWERCT